eukprot:SAG11_NODE_1812_length_4220_cov_3.629944_4_plen_74_part_00
MHIILVKIILLPTGSIEIVVFLQITVDLNRKNQYNPGCRFQNWWQKFLSFTEVPSHIIPQSYSMPPKYYFYWY